MKRTMYIENKAGGLNGSGSIGWVEMLRATQLHTEARTRFLKTTRGYKYNCNEKETGANY